MKQIFSFAIIATLLAFSVTSCIIRIKPSNDNVVEKTFDLKDFNTVDIFNYVDVVYVPGNKYSVKVKGPEYEINKLQLFVEDDHLYISDRKSRFGVVADDSSDVESVEHDTWHFSTGSRYAAVLTIYVTSPKLSTVNLQGSGSFDCQKDLHTEDLTLYIAGSGNIHFGRIYAKNLAARIDGSGDVKLDWLCANNTSYQVIGSGSINSKEFHTAISKAETTGSGDISVNFVDCGHSEAATTGSGNIFLSGTIESSKRNTYGSGAIHTDGLKNKPAQH